MNERDVLQAVRLKGRVTVADLATTIGEEQATVVETVDSLVASGLLVEGKTLKISPDGRVRLGELLAEERAAVDSAAVAAAYDEFRPVNAEFKALVLDWQLRDGQPNTHDDLDHDAAVLARLDAVHDRVAPILAAVTAEVSRLSAYGDKLAAALAKVKSGDTAWVTRPLVDSYHTVWFELHEELILIAGLTREDEAKAGHAE
jgi:DNA-binding MarR family transcriptional regulator